MTRLLLVVKPGCPWCDPLVAIDGPIKEVVERGEQVAVVTDRQVTSAFRKMGDVRSFPTFLLLPRKKPPLKYTGKRDADSLCEALRIASSSRTRKGKARR